MVSENEPSRERAQRKANSSQRQQTRLSHFSRDSVEPRSVVLIKRCKNIVIIWLNHHRFIDDVEVYRVLKVDIGMRRQRLARQQSRKASLTSRRKKIVFFLPSTIAFDILIYKILQVFPPRRSKSFNFW